MIEVKVLSSMCADENHLISNLPNEIMFEILKKLDRKDLASTMRICLLWKEISLNMINSHDCHLTLNLLGLMSIDSEINTIFQAQGLNEKIKKIFCCSPSSPLET